MEQTDPNLEKLYDELRRINPSENELKNMPGLQRLLEVSTKKVPGSPSGEYSTSVLLLILIPVLAAATVYLSAVSFPNFTASTIHKLGYGEAESETSDCLLRGPAKFTEWFRPPVDCSVCRNITQVDAVEDISVEEFTEKYAYTGRPLVVRGAMQNWTASEVFSFDFLRRLYVEDFPGSLDVVQEHCQFFKYKTEFGSLREVMTMSKDRFEKMWYVGWSNCDVSVANVLRDHYRPPAFLPAGSASSRLDWIFMGRAGYGANIHVDNVGRPSWQAQIRGTKEWTLEPPRECYFQCEKMKVTVYPNDIIVLDTDVWYHGTVILGDEISITIGSEYD